jgi:hypothetical protein
MAISTPLSTAMTAIAAPRAVVATHDLTGSLTMTVDAAPASVDTALRRLDLVAPLTRALRAMDATGRVALGPTSIRSSDRRQLLLRMIWRIDGRGLVERTGCFESFHRPGYIKVSWEIDVSPSERGALLSLVGRFSATDDRSWRHLLEAWELLGVVADAVMRHAARTVKAYAESLEEE